MDREITLADYGRTLWRGRWLIVATTVAAAVVGLLVTFASTTTYRATARVSLGQILNAMGQPAQTAGTNIITAPQVLLADDTVRKVASEVGVTPSRVRHDVDIQVPRPPGTSPIGQPAVAAIVVTDRSRSLAIRMAVAYANATGSAATASFAAAKSMFSRQLGLLHSREAYWQGQTARLARLAQGASGVQQTSLAVVLTAANQQLDALRIQISQLELQQLTTEQIEEPQVLTVPDSAASSTSAPNRARTMLLAAILGLVVGVIVTFVWRGSPARRGRAA